MGIRQQMDEGDRLTGKVVLVLMRPRTTPDCWAACEVMRYGAGLRLELEVRPVGGSGSIRVRSWKEEEASDSPER